MAGRDVTSQSIAQCDVSQGRCVVRCGNQLAGDPDFGQVKDGRIEYQCGDAQYSDNKSRRQW